MGLREGALAPVISEQEPNPIPIFFDAALAAVFHRDDHTPSPRRQRAVLLMATLAPLSFWIYVVFYLFQDFELRGPVQIKGMGTVDTWWPTRPLAPPA